MNYSIENFINYLNTPEVFEGVNGGVRQRKVYPVFLVAMHYVSPLAPFIKFFTKSDYNHSGLAFDSSLKEIFSFNGYIQKDTKQLGTFLIESIDELREKDPNSLLKINVIYLSENKYFQLKKLVRKYFQNKIKTSYNFASLFGFIINKNADAKIDSRSLVCSTFVAYCFHKINIKLTNKPVSLTTPKDISECENNKNTFTIFEGTIKDYNNEIINENVENVALNKIQNRSLSNVRNSQIKFYNDTIRRNNLDNPFNK